MRRVSRAALSLLLLATSPILQPHLVAQSASNSPPTANAKGQESNSEQVYQSTALLRATTRLVLVDVVAKDASGNPLPDLTAADFTITESGKPQKIKVFSFQKPEQAMQALPPLPPNVFSNVPRYKSGGAFNVILMDGLNSGFEHVADMRRLTLDFFRKLALDEPVAVYGLNNKLELLQEFTSAADAQQAAAKRPSIAGGTFEGSKFREVPASEVQIAAFRANTQRLRSCLRVQITLMALHGIVNSLAGLPGRKNLIWISDVFPFDIYTQSSQIPNNVIGECLQQYSGELSETAETMLDNQIAMYPVVAGGLENTDFEPSADVDSHGLIGGPRFAGIGNSQLQSLANLKILISDIAAKTGGEPFSERNDLDKAIRKSIDDGSTYYTLGYYPENKKWDGDFRSIQVKVNRKGTTLRYRLGYFATPTIGLAKTDAKSRGKAMNEALDPEAPSATSLPFESTFVPPAQAGARALVKFAIDPRGITFEKQADDLQHASVDCVVKVYSLRGDLVKTRSSTMNAKLSAATFSKVLKTNFPCEQSIELGPGSYVLHVGVIDNHTGLLGTASGKVTVF